MTADDPGDLPDLSTVPPDLETPPMVLGDPAPGRRVRQTAPEWAGTDVYHALYLPTDWRPGARLPVIVEYAGNGDYRNGFGDVSTGLVEGSNLGYGISGGEGFLWLCLPYVNTRDRCNQTQWWGDVEATVEYCKRAVRRTCEQWGGDPAALILCGFSRGAIACNYIGLHDDDVAALWRAFIPYSHYDGVLEWGYEGAHRASALERLRRLKGRPQFICNEITVEPTRQYLQSTGIAGDFTFCTIPFRNHNDRWALRDCASRREVRAWLASMIERRP